MTNLVSRIPHPASHILSLLLFLWGLSLFLLAHFLFFNISRDWLFHRMLCHFGLGFLGWSEDTMIQVAAAVSVMACVLCLYFSPKGAWVRFLAKVIIGLDVLYLLFMWWMYAAFSDFRFG
jgi:hypothetical protein